MPTSKRTPLHPNPEKHGCMQRAFSAATAMPKQKYTMRADGEMFPSARFSVCSRTHKKAFICSMLFSSVFSRRSAKFIVSGSAL